MTASIREAMLPPPERTSAMRHLSLNLPNGRTLDMSAPDGLFIPRVLERSGLGHYETDTLAAMLAVLSMRDGAFVDVGANVGVFSLLAAAVLGRQCYAYEPLPPALKVLRKTVSANELPIRVSEIALSDRAGTGQFYVSRKSDSSSGLNRSFRKAKRSFEVELKPLDDDIGDVQPALLKIDTETTEPAVLAGATTTLERHAPHLIVEVLHNRTEGELQTFFEGRGYHWYHVTDAERWPAANRLQGDPKYRYNNWMFAPEPLDDRFWEQLDRWRRALRAAEG